MEILVTSLIPYSRPITVDDRFYPALLPRKKKLRDELITHVKNACLKDDEVLTQIKFVGLEDITIFEGEENDN